MRLPGIIALEHIDGGGGTTQAALLADYIDAKTWEKDSQVDFAMPRTECLRMKFPKYDSPTGKLIAAKLQGLWEAHPLGQFNSPAPNEKDMNALVFQCLQTVNKLEVADEIERAVTVEGRTVVLDRWAASAIAYGMADGLDYDWLMKIHTRLPKAHHVFIDIPAEESWKRRPKRDDAYESDKKRLRLARINYLHLFEKHGVDTGYWMKGEWAADELPFQSDWPQDYRTSPSGWAIVNGLGTIDEVQGRIRKALGLE